MEPIVPSTGVTRRKRGSDHSWVSSDRLKPGIENKKRLKQPIGYILAKPHQRTTVLPACLRSAVGTRPPAGKQSLPARVFHPSIRRFCAAGFPPRIAGEYNPQ